MSTETNTIERSATSRDEAAVARAQHEQYEEGSLRIDVGKVHGFFALLWSQRRKIRKATLIALVISAILAFSMKDRYIAEADLMPPDFNPGSAMTSMMSLAMAGNSGAGAGLAGLSGLLGTRSTADLFISIVQSQAVEDRIIDRFKLKAVYRMDTYEDTRTKLESRVMVDEDKKSGVIQITVKDNDPVRATMIANAFPEEVNRQFSVLAMEAVRQQQLALDPHLAAAKKELDSANASLADFSSKNMAFDMSVQTKATIDAIAQVEGALIAAKTDLRVLQQRFANGHELVRQAQARVAELQHQLDGMAGTASNAVEPPAAAKPAATRGTADANAAKAAPTTNAPAANATASSAQGANASAANAEELSAMPASGPTLRSLPHVGVKYADVYRRAKVAEVVYDQLYQQYHMIGADQGRNLMPMTASVVNPATVPESPAGPARVLMIFVAVVMAFAASVVWVLAQAWWQNTDDADPRKVLFAPAVRYADNKLQHSFLFRPISLRSKRSEK